MTGNPTDLAEYQNDHDLLVELKTEMRGLRDDFRDMKDGVKENVSDHEDRIRSLEKTQTQVITWGSAGIVILGVAEFLLGQLYK